MPHAPSSHRSCSNLNFRHSQLESPKHRRNAESSVHAGTFHVRHSDYGNDAPKRLCRLDQAQVVVPAAAGVQCNPGAGFPTQRVIPPPLFEQLVRCAAGG